MRLLTRLSPLAVLLIASGCTNVAYRAPLPDMSVNCVESLRDVLPIALQYPAPNADNPAYVEFASVARCHLPAGAGPTPIALYRLDGILPPAELNVAVMLSTGGTFAAAVNILDSDFQPLRRFGFEEFTRRGSRYSLDVFLNPSERLPAYLLLMPDASQMGKSDTTIVSSASPIVIPAGPVMFVYTAGNETNSVRPFLEGGQILVTARPQSSASFSTD